MESELKQLKMNRAQWNIFAIAFFISSMIFWGFTFSWSSICAGVLDPGLTTACYIKTQSYAIPAIIFLLLSFTFGIVSAFEHKQFAQPTLRELQQ